ncbi:MAG TPA: M48 family peptidase [Terriglobia bacterium]|nr:M48 family peptidase [Terriglobia bacterium]
MTKSNTLQLSLFDPEGATPALGIAKLGPRTPNPESRVLDPQELAALFTRAFRRLRLRAPEPAFRVDFVPYAGLRSKIRLPDDHHAAVSLSDVLEGAPLVVIEALAEILLSRLFGLRPSREARDCYKAFVMNPGLRRRSEEARRARGFKKLLPARGRHFNLKEIFEQLNQRHFEARLSVAQVGWSKKASRNILGHYDSAHHTITISRWFDQPSVPRCLVEYLMFHEMLHIEHPVERNGHRRVVHSAEFRRAERKFPQYEEARGHLKRMSHP